MTRTIGRMRCRRALAFLLLAPFLAQVLAIDPSRAGDTLQNRAEMLQLTNEDRADRDRDALRLNDRLSRYARRHSREMAEQGQLFHTPDLAGKLRGVDWTIGAENIGMHSSLEALEDAFMSSRPHRRNILRWGFRRTAIGIVESDGSFWVTVIFYG
ncbi:MAG TPA: CAP domain-containing protein [Actinomycetota bacterium]|nr:CAP domain-containing protein [Actinomycetota bacterium]